jgi:hypothetical protein
MMPFGSTRSVGSQRTALSAEIEIASRKLVVQAAERSATGRRRRLTLETAGGM